MSDGVARLRPLAVLASRLRGRRIPTADIYFVEPLSDLIGSAWRGRGRPIRAVSPTMFRAGDHAIVLRYADERALASLDSAPPAQLHYLIDDNLHALGPESGLPEAYRERLARFRDQVLPRILAHATHVVAPSSMILAHYEGFATSLLDPAALVPSPGLSHFDSGEEVRIVFAGTRSHLADLEVVAGPLADLARRRPHWRITTFLGRHAPEALRRLPHARHIEPASWPAYRKILRRERFHIALAPAWDTSFNRSRSISRLFDHAAFGAAGLYSDLPPFRDVVEDGISGRLLPDDPLAWREALDEIAGARARARAMAAEGARLAAALGDRERVRRFWTERLALRAR